MHIDPHEFPHLQSYMDIKIWHDMTGYLSKLHGGSVQELLWSIALVFVFLSKAAIAVMSMVWCDMFLCNPYPKFRTQKTSQNLRWCGILSWFFCFDASPFESCSSSLQLSESFSRSVRPSSRRNLVEIPFSHVWDPYQLSLIWFSHI